MADFGDEIGDWLLRKSTDWSVRYGVPFIKWLATDHKNVVQGSPVQDGDWADGTRAAVASFDDPNYTETNENHNISNTNEPTDSVRFGNMEGKFLDKDIQKNLGIEELAKSDCIIFNCGDITEATKGSFAFQKGCDCRAAAYGKYIVVDSKDLNKAVNSEYGAEKYEMQYQKINKNKDLLHNELTKNKKIERKINIKQNAHKRATKDDIAQNIKETAKNKPDHTKAPSKAKEMGQIMTK